MMIVSGRPPAFDTLDRLMRNAQTAGGVLPESMTSLFANTSLDPYVDAAKNKLGATCWIRPSKARCCQFFQRLSSGRCVHWFRSSLHASWCVPQARLAQPIKCAAFHRKAVDVRARPRLC
jgi:hypothetical protein